MEIFHSSQFTRDYRKLPEGVKKESDNYRYRIIFEFLNGKKVVFHAVDDHSVYQLRY